MARKASTAPPPPPEEPLRITPQMLVERTRLFDVDEVRLMETNPNQGDIGAIHGSMEEFGQIETILVVDGRVVNGNHRVMAERQARRFGGHLAGIDASGLNLSEVRAMAAGLALNRTARLGHDDLETLTQALLTIHDEDEGLLQAAGWSADDLDDLLADLAAIAKDDDKGTGGEEEGGSAPSLTDRFLVPPFSVLDSRQGYWQERLQRWLDMLEVEDPDVDPVLCELLLRWYTPPEGRVLDLYASEGSVRLAVAGALGRTSAPEDPAAIEDADLVLAWRTEPLGADYGEALAADRAAVVAAAERLAPDRFAVAVVEELRDDQGAMRGLVPDTIGAFEDAGLAYHDEAILVTTTGSLPLRAGGQFTSSRKLGRTHRTVLVFVKGDPTRAADACGDIEVTFPDRDDE